MIVKKEIFVIRSPIHVREKVFFIITFMLCVVVLFHFIFPFIVGITVAYLLEPLLEKCIVTFSIKRPYLKWVVSVGLIFLCLVLIFGPFLTLLTTGIQELLSLLGTNSQGKESGQDLLYSFANKVNLTYQHFGLTYSIDEIVLKFSDLLKKFSSYLLVDLGSILSSTPDFILKLAVFVLTVLFFLMNGARWRPAILEHLIPWELERKLICETCASVLRALIVANLLVALIQAFFVTLTLGLFGLPRFVLLGMIAFFMSFIPILGTAPLMVSAAAWCYFSQNRPLVALGIILCGVLVSIVDNVLRPYFMKGSAEIQFYWIFLAIISGMSLLGISGAVVGPVIFALFAASLKRLNFKYEESN
jgi:predicted PurR-regulated permease PerM